MSAAVIAQVLLSLAFVIALARLGGARFERMVTASHRDHRLVNGAEAGAFLAAVGNALQGP